MAPPRHRLDRLSPTQPATFTKFSTDARRELGKVLGDAAPHVQPLLQELAQNHINPDETTRRENRAGQKGRGSAERARAIDGLRRAITRIDAYLPFVMTGTTLAQLAPGISEGHRLVALRDQMSARLRALERRRPLSKRRGRPIDVDRRWLAQEVAIVLRLSGVPVATSRVGHFAKVLEIMLTEMYGEAPEDLFRLIRGVAASVNDWSEAELRDVVIAARHYSNPSFWLRVAAV